MRKKINLSAIILIMLFNSILSNAQDYSFYGATGSNPMTINKLQLYLLRSMSLEFDALAMSPPVYDSLIKMAVVSNARYLSRVAGLWGSEHLINSGYFLSTAALADSINNAYSFAGLTLPIMEAAIYEDVSSQIDSILIPSIVRSTYSIPSSITHFDYTEILYNTDLSLGHTEGVPDINKPETQWYFYYLATSYINAGFEALHMGQIELESNNDPNHIAAWDLYTKIRSYATGKNRNIVLLNADTYGLYLNNDDSTLLFDFHVNPSRPFGCSQVWSTLTNIPSAYLSPYGGPSIISNNICSPYGSMRGGITPLNWRAATIPYLVRLDNGPCDLSALNTLLNGCWDTWGYDEISWFSLQTISYKEYWLRYAYMQVHSLDINAYFEMPGSVNRGIDYHYYLTLNGTDAGELNYGNQQGSFKKLWDATVSVALGNNVIYGSTVWNSNKIVLDDIEIHAGATLSFESDTVFMHENGLIFVQPGGKLNIINSLLTNDLNELNTLCGQELWGGIQAWGNTSLAQSAANQGWVSIQGGSVIQQASVAVTNCNPSDTSGSSGGVIQALSSSFINNVNAAYFVPYRNGSASAPQPDLSSFANCTFLTDNNFKGNTLGIPMTWDVYIHGTYGLGFYGCHFLNRDTFSLCRGLGEGIHSLDAGYSVSGWCASASAFIRCSAASYLQPSRFCGFANGIDAQAGTGMSPTVAIDQANFDTCSVGVFVSACNNVSTTRCSFIVGDANSIYDLYPLVYGACHQNVGLFIQNTQMFRTEGNTFTGRPNGESYWYNMGTVIANTGAVYNTVYRSVYDSLTIGVLAIGNNRDASSTIPYGLTITCDSFSKNTNDIIISGDGTDALGIAPTQSVPYSNAGNKFSGSTNNIVDVCNSINYYYPAADATHELPATVSANVTTIATGYANSCASSFSQTATTTTGLDAGTLTAHEAAFTAYRVAHDDSAGIYNALMDFANHDSLINVIDTSTSDTILYSTLLAGSPWLSPLAVLEAANVGLLSYDHLLQVTEANPDLCRSYDFLYALQSAYSIGSGDMIKLDSLADSVTRRTILESSLVINNEGMDQELNIMLMAFKTPKDPLVSIEDTTASGVTTDSTSISYMHDASMFYKLDSLDYWLKAAERMWTIYALTGYYYSVGNYTTAATTFAGVKSRAALYGEDNAEETSYGTLWTTLLSAASAGRDITHLNATDIAALDTSSTPVFTSNTAEQVIQNITTTVLQHGPPILPNPCLVPILAGKHPRTQHTAPGTKNTANDIDFAAYPNPTNSLVTFAWQMSSGSGITIMVKNILGEQVMYQQSPGLSGKIQWDTHNLATGIYIYHATDGNGHISTGKIVVEK